MSLPRIEHVNITVSDPKRTSDLMERLFDWHVRWSGPAQNGGHTIHVGSNDHYVALFAGGDTAKVAEVFSNFRFPINRPATIQPTVPNTRIQGNCLPGSDI